MASTIILSDNGSSSGSAGLKSTAGNDGTLLLQTTTSGGTATTAMTINNAQNVGINATPAAWGSSFKSLQVTSAALSSDTAGLNLSQNAYYDGTYWRYIATGTASLYSQGNGSQVFYHAASGSANAIISWSQDVLINNSGHLILSASGSLDLNILNTYLYDAGSGGYQKFPSGIIIQYGTAVFSASSQAITYPIAFTQQAFPLVTNGDTGVNGPSTTMGTASPSATGFTITSTSSGLQRVNWFVMGR